MKVLCLTGMPGSGKGEVVRVIKEHAGIEVVRMGDVVWDQVRQAGLPLEPDVVGPFANSEREKHGPDIWARRTAERVKALEKEIVLIDGVRAPIELKVFKEAFGSDLDIIAVVAPRDVRLQRILARGRTDDTVTEEAFDERDRRELSWGVGEVIEQADHTLNNQGTLEELRAAVLELCERINKC
jgi:dephospho-CoA kinase